ncbi:hypothetical protein AOZ07_01600 [Glutamicibacter halophytocola]|nr:hypothetical protein AOZ07_01600 [Glutamicibacter halophytocola]
MSAAGYPFVPGFTWLPEGWDIPSLTRGLRHEAATRCRGACFLGERRRGTRDVVGLGCQVVEVPASVADLVEDVLLAAEGQWVGAFLAGLCDET